MATDADVYPMPLFVQLRVSAVDRSAAWYAALGFESVFSTPAMAHLRYRKYADLMLVGGPDAPGASTPSGGHDRGSGVAIYLTVEGESVDDVAARASDLDAGDAGGPTETAWNTREVRVADPDGYVLVFSEAADQERTFDEVMGDPSTS